MKNLRSMIATNKVIEVEHPEFDGFVVEVAYISKDLTKKLLDRATTIKYSKTARGPEETVDNDLFLKLYTAELIKGWKGLKLSYLPELLPVDFSSLEYEPDDELEYSEENALDLMKNAGDFDNWLTSVIKDVKNFNKSS